MLEIWEDEAMDNEVGSFWELEIGWPGQIQAVKFFTYTEVGNFHLGCIYLALDEKLLISFGLLETVKSTREIHRSLGMRKSKLKGRAASFLLPQKLREDDGASNQKMRAKKLMMGQCKIWTLGQRGGKYVGGNKCLNLQRWSHVN